MLLFFFLWHGRSRSKARSSHEKKLLLRKLLHGHRWSHAAWQIIKTKTQTTKNTRQDADPPARFASHHQKDSKANSERGKSPFFPSSMADVALWLGPYMSISSKNVICTKTQKVRKCRQITTNQKPHKPARRPANPPARFAFRQRRTANQTHKRGKSPNKNTHKEDLPRDTAV